jgi:uncharacterized membrane protein
MSDLIVVEFGDLDTADRFKADLERLTKEQLLGLDDLVVVKRHEDGKVKIKQAVNLAGAGALSGSFWGLLIGLLFWAPWLGMAVGAAAGALGGSMADYGIDDSFVREVSETITPGDSAVFMLVSKAVPDKIEDTLKQYNATVLKTSLSNEDEAKLQEMFGEA